MFRCNLIITTSTPMSLIVRSCAKLLSEHDTQSNSARNTAKHPPKQSIAGSTASCSTPPATTTTTATTVPTTATTVPTTTTAAPTIAPTIIHSPGLRPHITSITGAVSPRRRNANVKFIAHLIEKSDKDNTVVSFSRYIEEMDRDITYPSRPPPDHRIPSQRKP
jgi:hypothetical protein